MGSSIFGDGYHITCRAHGAHMATIATTLRYLRKGRRIDRNEWIQIRYFRGSTAYVNKSRSLSLVDEQSRVEIVDGWKCVHTMRKENRKERSDSVARVRRHPPPPESAEVNAHDETARKPGRTAPTSRNQAPPPSHGHSGGRKGDFTARVRHRSLSPSAGTRSDRDEAARKEHKGLQSSRVHNPLESQQQNVEEQGEAAPRIRLRGRPSSVRSKENSKSFEPISRRLSSLSHREVPSPPHQQDTVILEGIPRGSRDYEGSSPVSHQEVELLYPLEEVGSAPDPPIPSHIPSRSIREHRAQKTSTSLRCPSCGHNLEAVDDRVASASETLHGGEPSSKQPRQHASNTSDGINEFADLAIEEKEGKCADGPVSRSRGTHSSQQGATTSQSSVPEKAAGKQSRKPSPSHSAASVDMRASGSTRTPPTSVGSGREVDTEDSSGQQPKAPRDISHSASSTRARGAEGCEASSSSKTEHSTNFGNCVPADVPGQDRRASTPPMYDSYAGLTVPEDSESDSDSDSPISGTFEDAGTQRVDHAPGVSRGSQQSRDSQTRVKPKRLLSFPHKRGGENRDARNQSRRSSFPEKRPAFRFF